MYINLSDKLNDIEWDIDAEMHGAGFTFMPPNSAKDLKKYVSDIFIKEQEIAENGIKSVINKLFELRQFLNELPHFIVPIDFSFKEALMAFSKLGMSKYSVYIGCDINKISAIDYPFLGSSESIFFENDECERKFRSIYVGLYQKFTVELPFEQHVNETNGEKRKAKRVLLVAYFAGPCRSVGVQRVNYWASNLAEASNDNIIVEVASACKFNSTDFVHHYVPDFYLGNILEQDGGIAQWAKVFRNTEKSHSSYFSTISYYWRIALERYFDSIHTHFDSIIISGNPFSCFDFANYAKQRWGSKVILDYRDPFANNPRIQYSNDARSLARYVEHGYNSQADDIIVVNSKCKDLVSKAEPSKIHIIENGFDERFFKNKPKRPSKTDYIKLVHAGTFYPHSSPTNLIAVANTHNHNFSHIGKVSSLNDSDSQKSNFIALGEKSYAETIDALYNYNIGVVFITETGFETPTKFYDYIGAGLEVLALTADLSTGGPIFEYSQKYDFIHWVENSHQGIDSFFNNFSFYSKQPKKNNSAEVFSRKYSAKKLLELLKTS